MSAKVLFSMYLTSMENARGVVIFRQGNYVGSAWNKDNPTGEAGVHAYRLFAPAEVPTRASWRDWDEGSLVIEQFQAAGCIADL